jgi:hypothetical protein
MKYMLMEQHTVDGCKVQSAPRALNAIICGVNHRQVNLKIHPPLNFLRETYLDGWFYDFFSHYFVDFL